MLPLVDKPIIQYGVEEALASGVDNIILVTGRGKNAIEDHFDVSVELETFLEARGKNELLAEIRKISNLINFCLRAPGRAARPRPRRAGHAQPGRRRAVRGHPRRRRDRRESAGAAADDRRVRGGATVRCSRSSECRRRRQLLRHHRRGGNHARASTGSATWSRSRRANEAPSNLAIIGRYILTPDIFPALEATAKDRTGEIQLTNGLRRLLK